MKHTPEAATATREAVDLDHLLADPSALVKTLERERDSLRTQNSALRSGLARLIERASASADMILPMIMEDVSRCQQELSHTKARLALAITHGASTDLLATMRSRMEALERELVLARELHADAQRIVPLLDEVRSLANLPPRVETPPAETPSDPASRCPRIVFGLNPSANPMAGRSATERLLNHIKGSGNRPPLPVAPAPVAESSTPPPPAGGIALKSRPESAKPSATRAPEEASGPFGRSLFGKLFGRG